MAYQIFQIPKATPLSDGRVLPGAKAYFYETGTTTPQDVYSDSGLTTPHANPVVADSAGVFAPIYLDPALEYRLTLKTSSDVLIYTIDPINDQILSAEIIGQYLYPQEDEETDASITVVDFTYPPGHVRRYGGVGDSNGTTGSGTNDTTAIQAAVDYAKQAGRTAYFPSGIYRHTSPIDFTGVASTYEFAGQSMMDTVLFADYTSASRVANFNLGNTSDNRARVYFHDFRLMGRGSSSISTKVIGVYCEYTSELTRFENVYVQQFEEGVLAANDYYTKFVNVQCVNNFTQGMRLGYALDGVTPAACFNVGLFGCDLTLNGGWGLYVFGAQSFSSHGASIQGNLTGQVILNLCEGTAMFGTYIEHANNASDTPTAQVYAINCNGVGFYGLACPSFMHDGSPIVRVETSDGITLNNFRCRTPAGPYSAIGVWNDGSTLTINDTYINDVTTGIKLTAAGRTRLNNVKFNTVTTRVLSNSSANKLDWNDAVSADVTGSTLDSANTINIVYTDSTRNTIDETKAFNITCTVAELNAGGKYIITPTLLSERWRIIDIVVFNETAFNAGGDRDVRVLDDVAPVTYTTVTAANLKAAAAVKRWGDTVVPFPATADVYTPTTAGHGLKVKYSGGTTDYASGQLNITVTAMRTA